MRAAAARLRTTGRCLALVGAAALVWAVHPVRMIVARDEASHQLLGAVPVRTGDPVSLTYVHSVYRQPATEELLVTDDGFVLARITSPSEAVLEYYARPERIAVTGTGFEIRADEPAGVPHQAGRAVGPRPLDGRRQMPMTSLRVLASVDGQRTLTAGRHRLPLFSRSSSGRHIVVSLVRVPRLIWLVS